MIERKEYLNKLIDFKDKDVIKVVTGVRRCGKSTLFALFVEYLKENGVDEKQIISVNLESVEYDGLRDYKSLHEYISSKLNSGMNYVFIDEVQNCSQFERVVDSLYIKNNVDLYVTGSNAYMLSGELATLLSGRYITVDMLPFSFSEYCDSLKDSNTSSDEKFNDYIRLGSFPYISSLQQNEQMTNPYLEGIYNTILIKDVASREGISDITLLENIIKTMASSIGSPISINKIANTLNSAGRKISVNTVERYVRALTDSYIFYKVNRYDIKGRQHLKTHGKYYIVDTGMRRMLLSNTSPDTGHVIENIVFLELLRRGYKVNIGKLAKMEVDFVAQRYEGTKYYQVAASVMDEKTLKRELAPLDGIPDHYPKILLTLDRIGQNSNHKGIRQLNIIDWLLNKDA
jgi:hypothetical protein